MTQQLLWCAPAARSMAEAAVGTAAAGSTPPTIAGFPEVPRFSSMYNYLELCDVGASLVSDTLQDTIMKTAAHKWKLLDDSRELSALEIVKEMRFVIAEDEPDRDLDRLFVFIAPADKVSIKREMAESEPEELELEAGMKLAEIDLTGDVPIETATFDGGGVIPQQVSSCVRRMFVPRTCDFAI